MEPNFPNIEGWNRCRHAWIQNRAAHRPAKRRKVWECGCLWWRQCAVVRRGMVDKNIYEKLDGGGSNKTNRQQQPPPQCAQRRFCQTMRRRGPFSLFLFGHMVANASVLFTTIFETHHPPSNNRINHPQLLPTAQAPPIDPTTSFRFDFPSSRRSWGV